MGGGQSGREEEVGRGLTREGRRRWGGRGGREGRRGDSEIEKTETSSAEGEVVDE